MLHLQQKHKGENMDNKNEILEWKNFKGEIWKNEINVSAFIDDNYKEYTGDDSFLASKSNKTKKVWSKCEKLLKQEMKKGLLDVELKAISGINSFKPGYIDKENEVVVGLQTDRPLKRIVNVYGGLRMARQALAAYNKKMEPSIEKIFADGVRKTHNDGVFDVYTPDIRKANNTLSRLNL